MAALEKSLGIDPKFAPRVPLYEVVTTLKAMLQEQGCSTRNWVRLLLAMQRALNTAYRERYGSSPYHVVFGRTPKLILSTLAPPTMSEWRVDFARSYSSPQARVWSG